MKSTASFPEAPGKLPIIGHSLPLMHDPLKFLKSLPGQGDIVKVHLGPHPAIVACTPELTRLILTNDRVFDKGGIFVDRAKDALGNGLLTCPHKDHRAKRRTAQIAFNRNQFSEYASVMIEQIQGVTDSWRVGQIIDIPAEMLKITTRSLLATIFGSSFDSIKFNQCAADLATIIRGIYTRTILPVSLSRIPTPEKWRYKQAVSRFRNTVVDIILNRQLNQKTKQGDLLTHLLNVRSEDSNVNEDANIELVDQAVAFFIGGIETTASTVSIALHLLSVHPSIDHQFHAELDQILAGNPATYDDISRLSVTGNIISETLRLYPPAWITSRTVTSDTQLGIYEIPAGTTVLCSPYLIHHLSTYPDPERFWPDRWINSRENKDLRNTYMPFGRGPRKCIGEQFGLTEAVLALATISHFFHLQPVSLAKNPIKAAAVLRPKKLPMLIAGRRT